MNRLKLCIFILFLNLITFSIAQDKTFRIHTVAFYNLENLFDTINDPLKFDEFSPMMEIKANRSKVYQKKVKNMAQVISDIGKDVTKNSPVIIGISEIENRNVLEDIINDPILLSQDYGIVQYDSPDARGIDVALLYQKKRFRPIFTSKHELKIYDASSQKRIYTRDQLLISGKLEGDLIHIIVNHWPSRRGGEVQSRPKRLAAAKLNKRLMDSLQAIDPNSKIMVMGDLNDNPNNASLKEILRTKKRQKKVSLKSVFNPYDNFFKAGLGTTAYRDSWSLFDQILLTQPFLEKDYSSFRFYKAGIYNKPYVITKSGKYKGYPYRSFSNGGFTGGYSDHFPVYVYLIKEVD